MQREVAVKVPHPARLDDVHARQRFVEEARAIARLEHPRIVAVYDASELEDGTVVLVMQYVAGPSLRQTLDAGPMPVAQACSLLADVADAVDAAHRAGVIHRDLKPSNILLDESLQPHVCDFGLALQESRQHECRGECAGTLAYMAPEQLRGESHQLDGRADIWAAGVILYEALTGRQPFQGRDRKELTEEIFTRDPRPPRQIDRRIGKLVERVCLRCLEKRPAHRYSNGGRSGGRPAPCRLSSIAFPPGMVVWKCRDCPFAGRLAGDHLLAVARRFGRFRSDPVSRNARSDDLESPTTRIGRVCNWATIRRFRCAPATAYGWLWNLVGRPMPTWCGWMPRACRRRSIPGGGATGRTCRRRLPRT